MFLFAKLSWYSHEVNASRLKTVVFFNATTFYMASFALFLSALLLLYDVTNKSSFDNIQVSHSLD